MSINNIVKINKKGMIGVIFILFPLIIRAQPIPMEIFVSEGSFLQSTISFSRPFSKESKYKVLNISSFEAHKEDEENNSSVMITDVTYSIVNCVGTGMGLTYNSVSGLAPTIGMVYGKYGRKFSVTIAPAFIFTSNKSMRLILNLTFRPIINDRLNLYLSSSNLFTYKLDGDHSRSYEKLRVGLDYKTFQFGVGANFDQFGINRFSNTRIGGFVRKEF